jgi:hypothetical protein
MTLQIKRAVFALAEREGFEPSMPVARHTAFREQRLQPLGHLSNTFRLTQVVGFGYRLKVIRVHQYRERQSAKFLLDHQLS